ncbi:MAG: class I SAM-dependent methyltransferase [Bryobacterales bacterium]|nr:class I SAM-dependent methyltransferase [Bryobacterales bacterium]
MHEILTMLEPGSLVLDLGCADGSFSDTSTGATVIRLDLELPSKKKTNSSFVRGDAANLPFRDRTFSAIISNHSLEHFDNLAAVLAEIKRIIRPDGALFVSVPDASTITDKLYRWLARGGGHVNPFVSPTATASLIVSATGMRHVATRTLYSSLSFLNSRHSPRPRPKRLLMLGGGHEMTLFAFVWLSRRLDSLLGTRLSVLGWAFYFGNISAVDVDTTGWPNVCVRCGSGFPERYILCEGHCRRQPFRRYFGFALYSCPLCGALNPFIQRLP